MPERFPNTYSSKRPGRYSMTLSALGTARVTFGDGSHVTLLRQKSPAQALRRAWRSIRKEPRHAGD